MLLTRLDQQQTLDLSGVFTDAFCAEVDAILQAHGGITLAEALEAQPTDLF
jgi:hypothetical protein